MEPIIFFYIFGIVVVFLFSKDYFTNYQYALFDSQKDEFDDTDRLVEHAFSKYLTPRLQFILSFSLFVLSTIVIFGAIGQILFFCCRTICQGN
jgi:hypothetical protein